ncbi:CDP-diacylglycerol--glycerol-3-phosphate 3-phosphatidyltransferase [Arthrobacter glacialis]|uniref:CDP-diacylglycerol--glycerol-3-phosphate 3-phosphatidyltransferase n=1 Tax=Arthrobacter glacialis TaxID=1664 RepID=A0A2S3ZU40_ARTGL|nr:CDP-diacylglycerol--glycerol-3-phosphate 3-phosphatidyltransferase [Arthrobacter glacialis]POH58041.1 CDP-diacylglycerol--glycerol-3-phosphate 3-phosphatidyltransferase [Arthrobacter glacialis]POH72740.1 CDP-diacylglycerol--glycerol-3-phosphate 3-phosphatidyltransferase [Arthrobacter glacialis]
MSDTVAPSPSNWNLPNALTLLRIVLVPFFIWAFVADGGNYGPLRWLAVALFVVAIYTDKLDGDIARARGLITSFGKIADPIADKLLIGSALIMLSAVGELWWWVTVVMLVREVGITLLRFVVIRYGVMAASKGGKLKTVMQTVAIFVYLLPVTPANSWLSVIALVIMLAALAVTVVTGVDYVVKAWQLRSAGRGKDVLK